MHCIIKNRTGSLAALLWIIFWDHLALNVYIPVFTLVFFDLHSNIFSSDIPYATRSFWYGICLGLPHIGNMLFSPMLSALSDTLGRRKILLACTFGALLFCLTVASGIISGSLFLIVLGAIVQGIFSRTNPIAQATIADISLPDQKKQNMGWLLCAICAGAFFGPLTGGFLSGKFFSSLNFSCPFWVAAGFAGISFLMTLICFEETALLNRKLSCFSGLKSLFSNSQILTISLFLCLTQSAWGMYYQFVSPVLKTLFHFSSGQLGIFMSLIAVWLVFTAAFLLKRIEKIFGSHLFVFSLALMLFGSLITLFFSFAGLSSLVWTGSLPMAMGDLISWVYLVSLYSDTVSSENQGAVMGICFIVKSVLWAAAGFFGGILMGISPLLPFTLIPFPLLIAIVLSAKVPLEVSTGAGPNWDAASGK